jgi:hypothetical protein
MDYDDQDDETFGPGAVQALNEDKLNDLNNFYIGEIITALQYNLNNLDAIKNHYDEDYYAIFQGDNTTYEEKHDRFNELIVTAKRQNNVFNRGGKGRRTIRYKRKRSNGKRTNKRSNNNKHKRSNRNKRSTNNKRKRSTNNKRKRSNKRT